MPGMVNPTMQPPYQAMASMNLPYGQMQNCPPKSTRNFQNEFSMQAQQYFQGQPVQPSHIYDNEQPNNPRHRYPRQGRGQPTQTHFGMYNKQNTFQGGHGKNQIKQFNNRFYYYTHDFDTSDPSDHCTHTFQRHTTTFKINDTQKESNEEKYTHFLFTFPYILYIESI